MEAMNAAERKRFKDWLRKHEQDGHAFENQLR
jgi:hypothetical protein